MKQELGSPKIRAAYAFLKSAEQNELEFTLQDLSQGSGWSPITTKANVSKKLARFLVRTPHGTLLASGVSAISEEAFCRFCSQSSELSGDPLKPLLTPTAEGLVIKAREAALAAVQHYNNPTVTFRTGNFVILIVIAFTALFHAVFERDGIDYVAYDDKGIPKTTPQGLMLWDLSNCADSYIKSYSRAYDADFLRAFRKNIELFIPIRNTIEHRHLPQLDPELAGHCQSMLFNLEKILRQEFTSYYSLNSTLTLALQFSTERSSETAKAIRGSHSAEYERLKKYISEFHRSLPDEIMGNPAFALRMWLVPKPAKDARASDVTLEYVRLDQANPEDISDLLKSIVAIKREVRDTRNLANLLATTVSRRVAAEIERPFAASPHHLRACLHHKVRPTNKSFDLSATQPMYCVYDSVFKRYVYTEDWVNLLIREYKDPAKYDAVILAKKTSLKADP